jgi:hypothetical protein
MPPTLQPIPSRSMWLANEELAFHVNASGQGQLVFTLENGPPANAAIDPSGLFTWTPSYAQTGGTTFTVQVRDSTTQTTQQSFTVMVVQQTPSIDPINPPNPCTAGSTVSFYINAVSLDGCPATYALTAPNPLPLGVSLDPNSGLFTWVNVPAGFQPFTVSVTNREGASSSANFSIGAQ